MADTAIVYDIIANDKASTKMIAIGSAAGIMGSKVVDAAFKFAHDSVDAFKESEKSQLQLQDAFSKFPGLSDTNVGALQKLNTELAKKTTFDDDATASGEAVLAQFKLTGTQIQQLTPLMQDYAAKTGKDLPEAADILGKALLGKGRALAEVGIKFKDAGSIEANYAQITEGLRTQVGGFAEKEGKSAAGQAAILGNQFGEVQETVGSKLVPMLTKLAGILLQVVDFVQKNSAVLGPLVLILAGFAAVVYTVITAQKIWTAVQTAFNVVMSLNPIGLVIAAIALLVAGVILAYKHSATFRDIVDGAFRAVKTAADVLWTGLKTVFSLFVKGLSDIGDAGTSLWHGIEKVFGFITGVIGGAKTVITDLAKTVGSTISDVVSTITGLPGRVSGVFGGMFDGIWTAFKSAVNKLIGGWNNLHFGLTIPSVHIPGTNSSIGGASVNFSPPNLPYLAAGGIVVGPTLAMIGERGPEAVIPLSRGAGVGGTTVTVNVAGSVTADRDLARTIVNAINDLQRVAGQAPLTAGF